MSRIIKCGVAAVFLSVLLQLAACSNNSANSKGQLPAFQPLLSPPSIDRASRPTKAQPAAIILGGFYNRSDYKPSVSGQNYDRLGVQARSIAKAQLNKLGRFMVLDRKDQRSLVERVRDSGGAPSSFRPRYIVNGNITAFGSHAPQSEDRYGYRPMFARLNKHKKQDIHARVTINVLDVETSQLVHTAKGSGIYKPGQGRRAYYSGAQGYNVADNGKALGLAIKDALNKLNKDIDTGKLSF